MVTEPAGPGGDQRLPVVVKAGDLIKDGPNEVVAKKFQQWKTKHERGKVLAVKRDEREQVLENKKELDSKRKHFINAFVDLCEDFFHAPVKDLKTLDLEALKVLEGQLVRKARPWLLTSYAGLILLPAMIPGFCWLLIFGMEHRSLLALISIFIGLFGTSFSLIGTLAWLGTLFSPFNRNNRDVFKSRRYLICRRKFRKIYGEAGMLEILQKGLQKKD